MHEPTSVYRQLLDSGVVSKPYASQIASGARQPGLKTALAIYRATGLKFGRLRNAQDRDIPALERAVSP